MKFVGDSIVSVQLADDGSGYRIHLPAYHRAAIGIFPGTKLFVLRLPKTRDLIVTTIDPEKWGDLWKLSATLKDVPGAARSIVDPLVRSNVNILIGEGLSDYSHDHRLAHEVFLLLDLAAYDSHIDGNTERRNTVTKPSLIPNHLVTEIEASALEFLHPKPAEDGWNFQFNRMEFFYRNKEHRSAAESIYLTNHSIVVPKQLIREVYDGNTPDHVACHIISDTEEKYIKVRFISMEAKNLLLRVEHREEVGAILSFMNVLTTHSANIINSYSRLTSIDRRAIWYALCELPPASTRDDLVKMLKSLDGLDVTVEFGIQSATGFDTDFEHLAAEAGLSKFRAPWRAPITTPEPSATADDTEVAPSEDTRLEVTPYYRGKDWLPEENTVFVAMGFDDQYEEFYELHIKETIGSFGLRPVRIDKEDVREPNEYVIEQIKRYIATSRFVVADLTDTNGNVIYEIGLAHAIGKQVIFICDERHRDNLLFDLNQYPHLFYSPFRMSKFDSDLAARVKGLLSGEDV